MEHSMAYGFIKRMYVEGRADEQFVRYQVKKSRITAREKDEILAQKGGSN